VRDVVDRGCNFQDGFEHLAALRSAIEGALEGKSGVVELTMIAS